jgi:transcriptional regulator with XRE-family HTH domain
LNTKNRDTRLFGYFLKTERIRLKLNQSEFAALGGVSKATQVAYEADATEPQLAYLWRLAEAGVDFAWVLIGRRGAKGPQWDLLFEIRDLVEVWAQERSTPPPQEQKDRLLRSLYNQFSANGQIEREEVESTFRMIR